MRYFLLMLFAACGWSAVEPLGAGPALGAGPVPVTSATPSGAAGGDLTGTYPNPTIKASVALTTPNVGVATATSVGIGGALVSTFSTGTVTPPFQVLGVSNATATTGLARYSVSAVGPSLFIAKSRGATAGTPGIITTGDSLGSIFFAGDDAANLVNSAEITGVSTGTIGTGQIPGLLRFRTAAAAGTLTTATQIDSGQNITVGNTVNPAVALFTGGTVTPRFQVRAASPAPASIAAVCYQSGASGPGLYLAKSRSGSTDVMGLVNANDVTGNIFFQGDDGTNYVNSVQIVATATGTPASTRMGGNLVISTGTDAAPTVMTAALTIDNVQCITTAAGVSAHARSVVSAAGTTVLNAADHLVVVTGSTTQTITLPAASLGHMLWLKNRSTGTVTVNRAGSDTIDGATSITLTGAANQGYILAPVGTDYLIYARAN